jgi:hypothetical protein
MKVRRMRRRVRRRGRELEGNNARLKLLASSG